MRKIINELRLDLCVTVMRILLTLAPKDEPEGVLLLQYIYSYMKQVIPMTAAKFPRV